MTKRLMAKLNAMVTLLTTDDMNVFCDAYSIASGHRNTGKTMWWLINKAEKYKTEFYKNKKNVRRTYEKH